MVLFKLLLLERKVLLFQSPVVDLTSFLLTLLSLHPGMLEGGLDESACVVPLDTPPLSLSPDRDVTIETSLDKDIDTVSIDIPRSLSRFKEYPKDYVCSKISAT